MVGEVSKIFMKGEISDFNVDDILKFIDLIYYSIMGLIFLCEHKCDYGRWKYE